MQTRRLVIITLSIIAIFLLLIFLFTRGGSKTPNKIVIKPMAEYAAMPVSSVTFTSDGAVVAQENHNSIQLTVSASGRILEVFNGYNGTVIRRNTFDNTESAYTAFMNALEGAGYGKSRIRFNGTRETSCSSGIRYSYELDDGSQQVFDTWSTSCSLREGDFDGNAASVRSLFQKQFPDYSTLVSGVSL